MKEIDVSELRHVIHADDTTHIVVDVRSPNERDEERIVGTVNIPMSRIHEQLELLKHYDQVYVHCGSGERSSKVCNDLESLGLPNVINIKGGMAAWDEHGFDVIKHGNISILRQVRIAAGSLVLLGVILASFVHMGFLLLSGFVGAGLIFAGLTNRCGMAFVLLRMPWNKI